MKRLKDKEFKEYVITVRTIRENYKDGNCTAWGKIFWCYKIDFSTYSKSRGGFYSQREMFDAIEEEIYIDRKSFKELIRRKLNKWLR